MPTVVLKNDYEDIDRLLRRFKKAVEKDNTLKDYRKHEFYTKPSVKRKQEKIAAIKRHKKELEKQNELRLKRKRY